MKGTAIKKSLRTSFQFKNGHSAETFNFPGSVRTVRINFLLRIAPLFLILLSLGCASRSAQKNRPLPPPSEVRIMEVTGYCECGECCGWKRSWWRLGKPVFSSGPNKGKPKDVGMTASGTEARRGTVAADTTIFPMGTVLYIPGYGWGRVEDRGSAIKGNRLDLFFDSHREALQWGRQQKQVKIWRRR